MTVTHHLEDVWVSSSRLIGFTFLRVTVT